MKLTLWTNPDHSKLPSDHPWPWGAYIHLRRLHIFAFICSAPLCVLSVLVQAFHLSREPNYPLAGLTWGSVLIALGTYYVMSAIVKHAATDPFGLRPHPHGEHEPAPAEA